MIYGNIAKKFAFLRLGLGVKVYVSSTFSDFMAYRNSVIQVLRKGGNEVVAMGDYVATGQSPPWDQCLADVASCEGYVRIFAWKYG